MPCQVTRPSGAFSPSSLPSRQDDQSRAFEDIPQTPLFSPSSTGSLSGGRLNQTKTPPSGNAKGVLLEYCVQHGLKVSFSHRKSGPDHMSEWLAMIRITDGQGVSFLEEAVKSQSKKSAEQHASKMALNRLNGVSQLSSCVLSLTDSSSCRRRPLRVYLPRWMTSSRLQKYPLR